MWLKYLCTTRNQLIKWFRIGRSLEMQFIKRNIPIFLMGLVLLVVLLYIIFASQSKSSSLPTLTVIEKAELIAPHTYVLGFPQSPVSLVIFADYQDPRTLPYLKMVYNVYSENSSYLTVGLRPYPKSAGSALVAKGAQVAGDEGKYWDFVVLALENLDKTPSKEVLKSWAQSLNLDAQKFQEGLEDKNLDLLVEADIKDAKGLGVDFLPAFFLNGELLKVTSPQDLGTRLNAEISFFQQDKTSEDNALPDVSDVTESSGTQEPKSQKEELTYAEKERIKTLMEIKYTGNGWDPKEVQPFRGQTVRWENTTSEPIFLQGLSKTYKDLSKIIRIEPGEYFEYKFPSGGIFKYQELRTKSWGIVLVDW